MILVIHSFVRPAPGAFFRPDRIPLSPPRAAVVKDGRVFSGHRRLVLGGREHGGRLAGGETVSKMIRVEPAFWRVCSRRKLVSGGSFLTLTMMQYCASIAKLRGGGPIL